jgi:hypothetical protein
MCQGSKKIHHRLCYTFRIKIYPIRQCDAVSFINETLKYLVGYEGFNHYTITPYYHEENGMVGRQNKEVLRHLRAYVFDARMAKQCKGWGKLIAIKFLLIVKMQLN